MELKSTFIVLFILTTITALEFTTNQEPTITSFMEDQPQTQSAVHEATDFVSASSCHEVVLYRPVLPELQQHQREFSIGGKRWIIHQQWDKIGLSAVVWEAALALTEYLESKGSTLLQGHSVIELGAGTGLVGMVASSLGAERVDITDKNVMSARSNLKLNSDNLKDKNVKISELEWGVTDLNTFQFPYNIILAADVIYIEDMFPDLLKTLWELSSTDTLILISCKRRYERDDQFFELAEKIHHFKYQVVTRWSNSVTIYQLIKPS